MLNLFRRLLDWTTAPTGTTPSAPALEAPQADDFSRLNSRVPLKDAHNARLAFVRREAILDRSEKIAGYEFSLQTRLQARMQRGNELTKRAYDSALLGRLASQGVSSLLGRRLGFITLSIESLNNALIDALPPQNTVLTLDFSEPSLHLDDSVDRLNALRAKGFAIGLTHHRGSDALTLPLDAPDFIEIDVTEFDGLELRTLIRHLKKGHPVSGAPRRFVARNVQSHDDFQFCAKCGFDFFQGPFISSRESLRPMSNGINHMAALRIVGLVLGEHSFTAIAEQLKAEPSLSYKLLRYTNSAALGLQHAIDNLTDAIVILGREKFARWLSLLIFDFSQPSYRERLLAERALARARTLELLAGQGRIPPDPNHLFLIGLFSLLDQVFGRPLAELLDKAALPTVVHATLLGQPSAYTDALTLVTLGEADAASPPEQLNEVIDHCALEHGLFEAKAAEALIWADQTLGATA